MKLKNVLGITGLSGCGKDTVAQYLKKKYNFEWFNFSDILLDECKKLKLEPTKMNLSKIGDKYRLEKGMGGLALSIFEKIKDCEKTNIVITGFRSTEEVDYIRNNVEEFTLMEIRTDPLLRWKRRKTSDPQNKEEFFERDRRDKELKGLGKVINMVDLTIINNDNISELNKKIDNFVTGLKE